MSNISSKKHNVVSKSKDGALVSWSMVPVVRVRMTCICMLRKYSCMQFWYIADCL